MNNENLNQETIVEVNGSEKKYNFVYGVSFKKALQTYFFGFDEENLNIHDKVVVETVRGLELGTIKIGARPASEIKLATAIKPILRVANEEDINNYTKNLEQAKLAEETFINSVKEQNLDMYLVSAEYILDEIGRASCRERV